MAKPKTGPFTIPCPKCGNPAGKKCWRPVISDKRFTSPYCYDRIVAWDKLKVELRIKKEIEKAEAKAAKLEAKAAK